MNARASFAIALLTAWVSACSSDERRQATHPDASAVADAGVAADGTGAEDAEPPDAGEADTGVVDVGMIDPPRIIVFTTAQSSVPSGQSTLLVWNTERADTISIRANPGGMIVDSSTITMGTRDSGPLTATTIFTLTAVNGGGMVSTDVMVLVSVDPGNPVIVSFLANPISVNAGETTTLSWETMNGMRVRILQGATALFDTMTMVDTGTFTTAPLPMGANPFTLEVSNFAHQRTALVVVEAN